MTENTGAPAQEEVLEVENPFIPKGEAVSAEDFAKYIEEFGEQAPTGTAEVDGDLHVVIDANGDVLAQWSKTGRFRKYPHPSVHPGKEV